MYQYAAYMEDDEADGGTWWKGGRVSIALPTGHWSLFFFLVELFKDIESLKVNSRS